MTTSPVSGAIGSLSPSASMDLGHFAAGSALDLYNLASWNGPQYAFSANLEGTPSASDRVVFLDTDNSLGLGGGVVETLGTNDWLLHLDDAASWQYDVDDNEMIIRLRIVPGRTVAEPPSLATVVLALCALALVRRRPRRCRGGGAAARRPLDAHCRRIDALLDCLHEVCAAQAKTGR